MKKHLLLLSLACFAISANSQNVIPNGGFETWDSIAFENPQFFPFTSNMDAIFRFQLQPNLVKTTDAYHGTYAAKFTSISTLADTLMGYMVNTNPSNGDPFSWTGGMPYNQSPTGIRGYYKYNVANTDSAAILVAFSKLGINIGTYLFKIGGIHNSYTLFNFAFNPPLPITPDSVIIAATSSDVFTYENGIPGSELYLDSISFTGVTSQPTMMNGDFELWQTQIFDIPTDWYVLTEFGSGFSKTTDAHAGGYAVELTTYLSNNNNVPVARTGMLSNAYYSSSCDCMKGGTPFSNQVDTLAFWYKYAPMANDSAQIVMSFKSNGVVFQSWGKTLSASSSYQYEEIPFFVWQAPDSVIIQILSSKWDDTLVTYVGSNLIIDDIQFKSNPLTTIVLNYDNSDALSLFPNPSNGRFKIIGDLSGIQKLEIYNSLAEKVYSLSNMQQQTSAYIDVIGFPKGIYFVKMYDKEKTFTKKIVIQ